MLNFVTLRQLKIKRTVILISNIVKYIFSFQFITILIETEMTQTTKPPNTFIKKDILEPKEIELNVKYSFSVNPNDDYQFWDQLETERLSKSKNHMLCILKRNINMIIKLTIDVSRTGRIHWHGTIEFRHITTIRYFYTEFVHEILKKHTIEMDTIKDLKIWETYCSKTLHLWNVEIETPDKLKVRKGPGIYKDISSF